MQPMTWNSQTGFKDLICGRSFWNTITVEQEHKDSAIVKLSNKSDLDGPRAAGIALAALLHSCRMDISCLPKRVSIKSEKGFKNSAKLIFDCFSDLDLRHEFYKSMCKRENIIKVDNEGCGNWKGYEEKVRSYMLSKFPGFEVRKLKGIRADGVLMNSAGDTVVFETKKKNIDLAEGLAQLIQYFCKIRTSQEFKIRKLHSYIVSPCGEAAATDNFRKGMEFLRSSVQIRFEIS